MLRSLRHFVPNERRTACNRGLLLGIGLRRNGLSAVSYGLDPKHPRLAFDWKARTTHYINLKSSAAKLKRLFETFSFAPLGEVLDNGIHRASS